MKIVMTDSATLTQNNDLPLDCFNTLGEVFKYDNLLGDELLEAVKDADAILCNKTIINKRCSTADLCIYSSTFFGG